MSVRHATDFDGITYSQHVITSRCGPALALHKVGPHPTNHNIPIRHTTHEEANKQHARQASSSHVLY